MTRHFLAVDLGTSAAKAGLVSDAGTVVARTSAPYPEPHRAGPVSERDPDDWWKGAIDAVRRLGIDLGPDRRLPALTEAVALCGVTLAPVLLDRAGRPLRSSILWDDSRGEDDARELRESASPDDLRRALGASFPLGWAWPLPRLRWLERNEPHLAALIAHWLQPKDWINFRLTGEISSDLPSQRGLANQITGRYEQDALEALGVHLRLATRIRRPPDILGPLLPEPAQALGLYPGIPVIAGTHDFTAAELGLGPTEDGEAVHIAGTSDHIGLRTALEGDALRSVAPLSFAPDASWRSPSGTHPGALSASSRGLLYGVISSGGGAEGWARRVLAGTGDGGGTLPEPSPTDPPRGADADVPPPRDAPLFAPYLNGERTPHWDPEATAAFVGLRTHHRASDLVYAVREGVAFALREVIELIQRVSGRRIVAVRAAGGATRIAAWNRIKAEAWGLPVSVSCEPDAGLVGCAALAAAALEGSSSLGDIASRMTPAFDRVAPTAFAGRAGARDGIDARYAAFRKIYPCLKEIL